MILETIAEEVVKGAVSATIIAIGAFVFVSLIKHNIPRWFNSWQEMEEIRHNNKMIEMKAQMMIRKEI